MKATNNNGELNYIPRCDIIVPNKLGRYLIPLRILPEITDSHGSAYQNETVIGRAFPIKTYSHGEDRSIGMKVQFVILRDSDAQTNLQHLRVLQSATYPRDIIQHPYLPPPICKIRCGNLLAGGDGYVCVVLENCSVSFPTDVAWYHNSSNFTYVPYKMEVDLSWKTVYSNDDLPGQDMIIGDL